MPEKLPVTSKSARTRRRILDVAAAAYREKGLDGVGVRDIMKLAGLTQGGFYSHFEDKDALFREASGEAYAATSARFVEAVSETVRQPEAFINRYLSTWHRDNPQEGCFMATLASEVARTDFSRRYDFAMGTSNTVKLLVAHMPGADHDERMRNAMVMVSSMVGVLTMSRVMAGTPMSDAVLADARRFFIERFAQG